MKGKALRIVVLIAVVALLAAFVPVAGQADENRTEFTGEDCWVQDLAPGSATQLGNGAVRISDLQLLYRDETSDPRTTGDAYYVLNMVLDLSTFSGPLWSTFEIVNEQGSWSGHSTGTLDNGVMLIHGIGHGSGAYEGLVGYWTFYRPGPGLPCLEVSGYIVETGAGH
jgi:hypothetical protein